jgi:hypothetical protein
VFQVMMINCYPYWLNVLKHLKVIFDSSIVDNIEYLYLYVGIKLFNKLKTNHDKPCWCSIQTTSPFFLIICGEFDLYIDRSLKHADWTIDNGEIELDPVPNRKRKLSKTSIYNLPVLSRLTDSFWHCTRAGNNTKSKLMRTNI